MDRISKPLRRRNIGDAVEIRNKNIGSLIREQTSLLVRKLTNKAGHEMEEITVDVVANRVPRLLHPLVVAEPDLQLQVVQLQKIEKHVLTCTHRNTLRN